jgi:hypothetical protein
MDHIKESLRSEIPLVNGASWVWDDAPWYKRVGHWLWRLWHFTLRYYIAGIAIVGTVIGALALIYSVSPKAMGWTITIALPGLVIGFFLRLGDLGKVSDG